MVFNLPPRYFNKAKVATHKTWFIFVGNVLEWYEFSVFGYLVNEIEQNFFNGSGSLATWSAYAVTFLARPLGALMLGWVADHCGRRTALLISLLGMILSTVGQGCLPSSYCCGDVPGVIGVVMLIILRVVQGICTGGEIGGVSTYLAEHEDKHVLGMLSATVGIGASIGFMLSSMVILILHLALSDEDMLLWGWRVPFLLAIIPGCFALYGRNYLEETDEFLDMVALEKAGQKMDSNDVAHISAAPQDPSITTSITFDDKDTSAKWGDKSDIAGLSAHDDPEREMDVSPASTTTPPLQAYATQVTAGNEGEAMDDTEYEVDDITGARVPRMNMQNVQKDRAVLPTPQWQDGADPGAQEEGLAVPPSEGNILPDKKQYKQDKMEAKRLSLASANQRSKFPLGDLVMLYPYQTFTVLFGLAAYSCTWYVTLVYSLDYIRDEHNVSASSAMGMAVVGNAIAVVVGPFSGVLVDGYGVGNQMMWGVGSLVVFSVPAWAVLVNVNNIAVFYIIQALMGVVNGCLCATPFLWVAEAFPTNMRASGFFAYNIAVSVFGGCGPLICDAMVRGWSAWGPALYVLVCCVLSLFVVCLSYYLNKRGTATMTHIRHTPY
ncbi:hypothetical protein SARC_07257 [Sphaeroforma arctica JP610]|uniref:Major facilitator superfamily (MFS) profile domain-containing protein n=1 Tax=Sphaeroforma arctica JP610 TaxID=667725 RepID=A0A0L0FU76_9EUKA|nr:hypothetical protein SARC_07257 [Sphaeroforma arctica JP610]KNC80382.1 hypothetical protein SARC_07257 [Sphaeroforma arctica JP610]|eukprot:XP_014154284.1 hypothetical protein SARC_07257 [Sphaeroforma arctica JP610]